MGDDMKKILSNFFADASGVCGHENTFHAIFCHQLWLSGHSIKSYAREYKLDPRNNERTDLVFFADQTATGWTEPAKPRLAIEFKGGAHNRSNALRGAIDADGYCTDLGKLLPHRKSGIECWFICIDMIELGIALSLGARRRLAERCAQYGINLAYHAQGEPTFLLCHNRKMEQSPISSQPLPHGVRLPQWRDGLASLPSIVRNHSASEDTYASLLYSVLRQAGFGARQLSLETNFNCANGDSRMKQRPDICVFGEEVNGRFNLYRQGDIDRSNDGIKIRSLQALIEIKGSNATEKLSDAKFAKQIAADLDKLTAWRTCFEKTGYLSSLGIKPPPEFVMIAIDNRINPISSVELNRLHQFANAQNIAFHYLHAQS
jgi:hypothetical protein